MVEVICERKYCKWNELGECKAKQIHVTYHDVVDIDNHIGETFSVCKTVEIVGSEA